MKSSIWVSVLASFILIDAYSQELVWEKTYGGKQADYQAKILATADDGILLAGSSISQASGNKTDDSKGNLDFCLWKLDRSGEIEWQKTFGTNGIERLKSCILTRDGGYLLGGITSNEDFTKSKADRRINALGTQILLIKLNAFGAVEWEKTFGYNGNETLSDLIELRSGDFLIGANTTIGTPESNNSETENTENYWILKISPKGDIVREKIYGGDSTDQLRKIIVNGNNYFLAGVSNSNANRIKRNNAFDTTFDFWILSINSNFEVLWEKQYGGDGDDQLVEALISEKNELLLYGTSNSGSSGNKTKGAKNGDDLWLIRTDLEGTILSEHTYDFTSTDTAISLFFDEDRNLILSATTESKTLDSRGSKCRDFALLTLDKDFEIEDKDFFSGEPNTGLAGVIKSRKDGVYIGGTREITTKKGLKDEKISQDFVLLKLASKNKKSPDRLKLEAFPNPTAAYTNIVIDVEYESGKLLVTDMSGRDILRKEISNAIEPIDLSEAPAGIYIVTVETEKGKASTKIIKNEK